MNTPIVFPNPVVFFETKDSLKPEHGGISITVIYSREYSIYGYASIHHTS